ncbi:hypothetical protein [Streptomyces xanthii]|uniref:PPE family domain-containing protein n=1 Tax=Streptomyces xanthii TaxID=2768069 RepID=A0A7H1B4V8_9ACTN|nr:hypothetical protein [Streptomyces xanthii]QNS03763.1 hypothetical protein IAG42_09080 [Streptomyces xanthii]
MTDHKHDADRERVSQQNTFTDFAHDVEDNNKGGHWINGIFRSVIDVTPVGQALDGRKSNFERSDITLNQMLDMVDATNPEDLETSGSALWDARDAIKKAASELDGHITKVHWVGESGDSFRKWGAKLVTYAEDLGKYAGTAGDQLSAASMGLSSVRGAMPPRDERPADEQKMKPSDYPAAKQVDSNDKYAAAVKVEKHRQEAINQMNRLSSYYAVSTEQLQTLQESPPKLETMPNVGVPKPQPTIGRRWSDDGGGRTGDSGSVGDQTGGTRRVPDDLTATPPRSDGTVKPTVPPGDVDGSITVPDRPVGTEIDSVDTLPRPTTNTPPPTTTGPTNIPNAPTPTGPSGPGYVPQFPPTATGRTTGPGATRNPLTSQGPGQSRTGQGRTSGPAGTSQQRSMGRGGGSTEMGRSTSTGRSAGAPGKGTPPSGRAITGGTARPTNKPTAPGTGGGKGVGRSTGVVGGRQTPTGRAGTTNQGGSRIPRGSVIGTEGAGTNGRSTAGRVGQRGVFGAQGSTASGPARGGAGRNAAATRGGAGLVGGAGKNRKPKEEETETSERPDYVVEDPNTHLPADRRDVPPVVN